MMDRDDGLMLFTGDKKPGGEMRIRFKDRSFEVDAIERGGLVLKEPGPRGRWDAVLYLDLDTMVFRVPLQVRIDKQRVEVRCRNGEGHRLLSRLEKGVLDDMRQQGRAEQFLTGLFNNEDEWPEGRGKKSALLRFPGFIGGFILGGVKLVGALCLVGGLGASAVALGVERYTDPAHFPGIIATELLVIESPVTGHVVFASQEQTFVAGEPLLVIMNRSGRQVLVEAPKSGQILHRAAQVGQWISKGDVVLRLDNPETPPVLKTMLPLARVAELSDGAWFSALLENGEVLDVEVSIDNFVNNWRDVDPEDPMIQLEVGLPADYREYVGQLVDLKIAKPAPKPCFSSALSKTVCLAAFPKAAMVRGGAEVQERN